VHLLALVCIHQREEIEMSIRRLLVTGAAMAAIAVVLSALTPPLTVMTGAFTAAQRTVDVQGADVLISAAAGLLAWAVWAWGAVGLTLTAASALPGMAGTAARAVLHAVLPAGARRSAALVLGLGLGVAGPLVGTALAVGVPAASAATPAADVPDWPLPPPATDAAAMPDWPSGSPAAGSRVVVRGDCLWHIAADHLLGRQDRPPTDDEVAVAVQAWWTANADVIGPDPDLLLPGQVLRPPGPP
jgi:hypothetical protein